MGRPLGSKSKKKSKRLVEMEKKVQIIEQKSLEAVLEEKTQFSVKIIAIISERNDAMGNKIHFKMMKDGVLPLTPCESENVLFKITYEEAGISINSTIKKARIFIETVIEKIETISKEKKR